tara:strand:+ start:247 stop:528 length:282 start_codon:yes stop_codon:yes gene_type:complete
MISHIQSQSLKNTQFLESASKTSAWESKSYYQQADAKDARYGSSLTPMALSASTPNVINYSRFFQKTGNARLAISVSTLMMMELIAFLIFVIR